MEELIEKFINLLIEKNVEKQKEFLKLQKWFSKAYKTPFFPKYSILKVYS